MLRLKPAQLQKADHLRPEQLSSDENPTISCSCHLLQSAGKPRYEMRRAAVCLPPAKAAGLQSVYNTRMMIVLERDVGMASADVRRRLLRTGQGVLAPAEGLAALRWVLGGADGRGTDAQVSHQERMYSFVLCSFLRSPRHQMWKAAKLTLRGGLTSQQTGCTSISCSSPCKPST